MKFNSVVLYMEVKGRLLSVQRVKRPDGEDDIVPEGAFVPLTRRQEYEARRLFTQAEGLLKNHFSR